MHSFLRLLSLSKQWKNAAVDFARMDCASADKYVVDHADKICGAEPDLLIASNIAEAGKRLASHPHYRQRGIHILEMLTCNSPRKIALIGFAAYCDAIKTSPLSDQWKCENLKFLLGRFDDRFLPKSFDFWGAGRVRAKLTQQIERMDTGRTIPIRVPIHFPVGRIPFSVIVAKHPDP